ncbi:hypothetical protein PQX77_015248 [Marasmius sp. AFHP31]|nr:hypothetical protein PQX77_015248 [Marasmius sp. AFHP31]
MNLDHKDLSAIPYKKTEGCSFMVADYFGADFGWLCGSDGSSAQHTLFPGADQDGYFSANNFWEQANAAIDIVQEQWPDFDHVFIYDNATTHLKHAEDALSAHHMPKGISDAFEVELVHQHPVTGKVLVDDAGKPLKCKIQMSPASFADGTPQPLYYPEGHNLAGKFKGIVNILTEQGIFTTGKKLECNKFKCPPPAINCCCHRMLYN